MRRRTAAVVMITLLLPFGAAAGTEKEVAQVEPAVTVLEQRKA